MLEKFDRIKELAAKYEAAGNEHYASLYEAITELSPEDRNQFVALMLFGRDYLPTEGDDSFGEYAKFAKECRNTFNSLRHSLSHRQAYRPLLGSSQTEALG